MPWLREDPEYLRKPFISAFALVCEYNLHFSSFDKLSSAAEDHTPASCRPQQKAIIIAILKCRERFHACIKDRQTAGDCELCALRPDQVAPQNPKRLRRLLSRAICITETAFLYCNHNGAGPRAPAQLAGLCSTTRSIRAHGS